MPHVDLALTDVPLNSPFRVTHAGMNLVVMRTESQIVAYEDSCPHAFWPLSEGSIANGVLECPGHGWEFDVATGRCVNAPAYCLTAVTVLSDGHNVRLHWENKQTPAASQRA